MAPSPDPYAFDAPESQRDEAMEEARVRFVRKYRLEERVPAGREKAPRG